MTRQRWKNKIKKACMEAGSYHTSFQITIDTLAGILETRDKAEEKYIAAGSEPIVKHTNKGGATNIVKNPALAVVESCNIQALAYLRDLGLTAKGLKSLGMAIEKKEEDSIEDWLSGMGV